MSRANEHAGWINRTLIRQRRTDEAAPTIYESYYSSHLAMDQVQFPLLIRNLYRPSHHKSSAKMKKKWNYDKGDEKGGDDERRVANDPIRA